MDTYHGTSSAVAASLVTGTVSVQTGGGEFGQGFYTGELLYLAKAWAFHRTGDRQNNVVQFTQSDTFVLNLTLHIMDKRDAAIERFRIKAKGKTRTFLFNVDMVWAPIVGGGKTCGNQCKWESVVSENLLNGSNCIRTVL